MRTLENGARKYIYPYVVGELSNNTPTFALWGWKIILVSTVSRNLGINGRHQAHWSVRKRNKTDHELGSLCSIGTGSNDYIAKYLQRGEKQPPEPCLRFRVQRMRASQFCPAAAELGFFLQDLKLSVTFMKRLEIHTLTSQAPNASNS